MAANKGRPEILPYACYQKWMIRSLAAITAQFLEGAITGGRIAVECIRIQRTIVGNFGTQFDLRREPVLPSQGGIRVVGDNASPLPLRIHEELSSQGEVVYNLFGE
jgi:hypothetical protein